MLPELTRRALLACSAAFVAVRATRAEPFTLRAAEEEFSFGDIRLKAAAYNGAISGPALAAAAGRTLNIIVENATDFPFSFEVQGLRGKAVSGNGTAIAPGERRQVAITPPDPGVFAYRASGDRRGTLLAGPLVVAHPSGADNEILLAINTLSFPDPPRTLIVNGAARAQAKARPGARLLVRLVNLAGEAVNGVRLPDGAHVVAIDGQPSEPFPPFDARFFLPPFGRADIALDAPREIKPVVITDAFDPTLILAHVDLEGQPMPAPALPAQSSPNPALPREIPLASAVRGTWKPDAGISDPLVKADPGRTVVLTFENDVTPRAILLEGHSARHLDALDDGWKPWWQDTHLLHPHETARLAFRAEEPGCYAVDVIPLEGDGDTDRFWIDIN